jgi:hypothetical protein
MARLPYWWAWKIYRGKPIRRGPYNSEQEAYREGMRDLGGDFEVVVLDTRDSKVAKHKIADIILRRTQNLELALSRQGRQPIKGEGETQ